MKEGDVQTLKKRVLFDMSTHVRTHHERIAKARVIGSVAAWQIRDEKQLKKRIARSRKGKRPDEIRGIMWRALGPTDRATEYGLVATTPIHSRIIMRKEWVHITGAVALTLRLGDVPLGYGQCQHGDRMEGRIIRMGGGRKLNQDKRMKTEPEIEPSTRISPRYKYYLLRSPTQLFISHTIPLLD